MAKTKTNASIIRGQLPDCLLKMPSFMMYKIAQYLKEEADAMFSDTGINARGFGTLHVLIQSGPKTQQALCEALWIDRGSMVGVIDALEKAKLVVRKSNPDDARSYIISATDKGRSFHLQWSKEFQTLENKIFPAITAGEWQDLRKIMKRLIDTCDVTAGEQLRDS